jgi:hypothetical protein
VAWLIADFNTQKDAGTDVVEIGLCLQQQSEIIAERDSNGSWLRDKPHGAVTKVILLRCGAHKFLLEYTRVTLFVEHVFYPKRGIPALST